MTVNLKKYSAIRPSVKAICLNNSGKDCRELVSLIAVSTGAPCIVAAYYYAEYIGHISEALQAQIDSIKKFYGYSYIEGIENLLKKDYESK